MTQPAQKWENTKPGYDGFWDSRYPNGDKPSGPAVAPNSGAILSGGTIIRGPYFANGETSAPTDSNFFVYTNGGATIDYSGGTFKVTTPANFADTAGATIRTYTPTAYQALYMDFMARMPTGKHGCKFSKFFGRTDGVGSANGTPGIDYSGVSNGSIIALSIGDGSTTGNDTAQPISLDTSLYNPSAGANSGADVSRPNGFFDVDQWGTDWHHFRIAYFASTGTDSANDVFDGAGYIEVDGQVYLDVGQIRNRHYQNSLFLDGVGLVNAAQGLNRNFEVIMEYKNIIMSVDGFV